MKSFSNSTICSILPLDVWEITVRFNDSPDFTILPLLPDAILQELLYFRNNFSSFRFFLFYRLYYFLGTRLKNEVVYNYEFF